MDFDLLPIDEILQVMSAEPGGQPAFRKILDLANKTMPSEIWKEFDHMDIERDMEAASQWMQTPWEKYPDTSGIYLGLDTLNMDDGKGTNVELGLSKSCNPKDFSDDWAYDCEDYGTSHLIKGLYEVSEAFSVEGKWISEEQHFAEYVIFLGYSGIVLRAALNNLETENDFLSIWGFHDGDLFFLVKKADGLRSIVTEVEL